MNWQSIVALVITGSIMFASAAFTARKDAGETKAHDGLPLRSLKPPVLMPNGTEFKTWESPRRPKYSRTYYVDGRAAHASDENPGTRKKPFKTIAHAAQLLQPGERVVVASGIYRERVAPARGGAGPDRMIAYEAEKGSEVIIKGSRVIAPQWAEDQESAGGSSGPVWRTKLESAWFADGYNPFGIDNVTTAQFDRMPWAQPEQNNPIFHMARGLVFQDGRRLRQVVVASDLGKEPGAYWVDRADQALLVRPFGDVNPAPAQWEITTQETVFAPREENIGFIRVKGLTIEHSGGPWPFEQIGALSTMRGHHWIIEDNVVRESNGAGMDIGMQRGRDYTSAYGHHIVRRNRVSDCGIVGICGRGQGAGGGEFGLLVENNFIERCGYHDAENLHECGGIKLHHNKRCLIRRNLIVDTLHGPGMWIGAGNVCTRVSENIILRSRGRGGLFFEISSKPNLVDRNIIWDSTTFGILEADGNGQTFANNLVGKCRVGIELRGRQTDRVKGKDCGHHEVFNNVIVDCAQPISECGDCGEISSALVGNVTKGVSVEFDVERLCIDWRAEEPPPATQPLRLVTHDFLGAPVKTNALVPGPFAEWPLKGRGVNLNENNSFPWRIPEQKQTYTLHFAAPPLHFQSIRPRIKLL